MFGMLAGGYPFGPLPGMRRSFGDARGAWRAGALHAAVFDAEADRYVAEIVAEQQAGGLDLVDDALARFPGEGVGGLARALVGGTVTPRDLVDAWRRAAEVAGSPTKAVLPGPVTAAAVAGIGRRHALARVIEGAVALAGAGCPMILLVEPALVSIDAGTGWRSAAGALERTCQAAGGATHICLAVPGGAPDPAGHARLAALPLGSVLVDVTAGPPAWRFLAALPPETGVVVGACDARSSVHDDPEMLVWAATIAAETRDRGPARVGIAPSGSMASLDRHDARRKAERLGEAVRLSRMGPLGDVARALQPDPATCRIASLRRLMADHAAALA